MSSIDLIHLNWMFSALEKICLFACPYGIDCVKYVARVGTLSYENLFEFNLGLGSFFGFPAHFNHKINPLRMTTGKV